MSNTALELAYWVNQSADLWWRSFGHAAVQVGIVAVIGLVLVSLCKRWSSPLRYGILVLLLLKFALTPALLLWFPNVTSDLITVEVPVGRGNPLWLPRAGTGTRPYGYVANTQGPPLMSAVTEPVVVSEPVLPEPASSREAPALWRLLGLKGWGMLLHLSGSLMVLFWLLWQSVRLAAWVVRRSAPAPAALQALSREVQAELGYFKRLDVRVGAEAGSPMAFQLLRPMIVLPQRTAEALSDEELRPVLAHEIAHLKRRDPLVNTLQILLFGIWWFHPAYWWLSRKLRRVREECCDDTVLALDAQREDRYCQTLLDAARSCQIAAAGRVVLGFGESRSSLRQRITRIMDPRASKRARLGWLAALVLAVVVLASVPIWQPSSSLDRPRPVTEVGYSPGGLESVAVALRLKDYPGLSLSAAQFTALEDCIDQAHLTRSSHNDVTDFELPSTRDALMNLRDRLTEPFYTEFLLAKWYEINDDPNEAARWMAQSLAHAPVVLVRKYELTDGQPLAYTLVGHLGVEYRVKTPTQTNTSLELDYVHLTTDEKGQVYLPGYDTRIRCNGTQWPQGYEIETGRHGYLALHARYNRLPTIYAWPKGVRRPAMTMPTSVFYDYRDAVEARGLTHRVGLAEFAIESCYRAGADGRVTVTDGRTRVDSTPEAIPAFSDRTDVLDQAVVRFKRSTLKSHEILQVRVFDHRSRGLLTEYHAPAAYEYDGDNSIVLRSLGAELPERVDVWFWVTEFAPDQGKQTIPPTVGSQAKLGGCQAELVALHAGHSGYGVIERPDGTSSLTFNGPVREPDKQMQVAFKIRSQTRRRPDRYARVAVVTKDRHRYYSDYVVHSQNSYMVFEFYVPLSEVDHLELLPVGRERCFYFDGVLLPGRPGEPIDDTGVLEAVVRTNGQVGVFIAEVTLGVSVEVTVVPGRGSISHSSRSSGLDSREGIESWEPGGTWTDKDTHSTIVWRFQGLNTRLLKTEILNLSGHPFEPKRGSERSGSFYHQSQIVPVERIQGVRIRLSRDTQR
ncbi:MAG: M56 family metallopeptidase [Sedimentisphaerales bacterium]|nr:M56 family metallopeptidase [Sedimentisphaerales bacterium]